MSTIESQIDSIARDRAQRTIGADLMDIYDKVIARDRLKVSMMLSGCIKHRIYLPLDTWPILFVSGCTRR